MKILKTLAIGLLAMGCVSIAQAQTTLRLTGSTAYRGNVHTAITHIYDAGFTYGYVGTSLGGAVQAIFSGNIGGQPVVIKTFWTGSEGGIQTVAAQVQIPFLPAGTPMSTGGTGGATQATAANGGDVAIADVAMSDSFQSSSAFFGLYRGVTYPTLTESPNSPVGVVPFKWLANKGAPAALSNLTTQQAKALFGAGKLPLAFFTGNSADETTTIVATGRDPDSGTRLTAFAEGGLGALASVKQYQPRDSGGNLVKTVGTNITNFVAWPASTVNGIPIATFNGGYNSGGDLTKAMANFTPSGFALISYAGVGDADTNALPNGGIELSFNGVTLGNTGGNYNTATVLTEGKYTFWGYEHLYYRSGTSGTPAGNVADAIANQLKTTDAQVLLTSMKSERSTDGSVVFPTYTTISPP
jgi:hypothetical protein